MIVIGAPLSGLTDWSVMSTVQRWERRDKERIEMQQAPPPEAPFADKMAYYRTQHTSKGVRATRLIGTPIIAAGMPLMFAKPKVGATMFIGGWAMQIIGHRLFEKNLPS